MDQAHADWKGDMRHEDRRYCIICDYAQNLGIPHFGKEQPGETCYFSPKSVFIFGMTDVSHTVNERLSFAYTEDIGQKGGNNVASLLLAGL